MDPISSKITLTNKKERRKRKSEEENKKSNGFTLSFYDGYFGDSFWPEKKLLDARGPFDGNVFKNPARYTQVGLHFERGLWVIRKLTPG